ncbi:hypothetical protein BHM03_00028996 [Ensete ventricosum]|nr:hypothetical protein BHM03_00028996 [Ensete ventricosum]
MDSMYRFGSTPLRGPPASGRYCVSSREGTRRRLIFQQENETTPCLLTRERGTTSFSRGETRRFSKPNHWAVRTGPPVDRYADHPLPGGTVDQGCSRTITIQNRSVTIDFDCRRTLPGGISLAAAWLWRGRRKKKEKEGEPCISIRRRR